MPNFQTLSSDLHSEIRVDESKLTATFAKFHLVNVEIKEAGQASCEYPLFFSKAANNQYWTQNAGETLFLSSKRPTAYLDNKKKLLSERVSAMQQTAALLNQVSEMELIQPVDLIIEYADNTQQRVGGLATVNEHRLQNLSSDEMALLHEKGLLNVLFNVLGSIFQVNRVIRLHNTKFPSRAVKNVKFETSKS